MIPVPDIDRTDFLLALGANPVVSNGSLMSAPDVAKRLKALRARGGKLIVIDPRRTETAELADQHHFIRPGSDAWLLLALLHVIFEERLDAPGRLAPLLDGLERLRELCQPYTPQRAAAYTGIDAEAIDRLATHLAARHARGHQVVLVSSGSIATGFPVLGLDRRPRDLATQQASASIGQGMLIAQYSAAFQRHRIVVGQVLLTADDVIRRSHYRNAQRTLFRLLELGVVPIVNENDTVATDEIRVGGCSPAKRVAKSFSGAERTSAGSLTTRVRG